MLLNKKLFSSLTFGIISLASFSAVAHEAGDIIFRAGVATVSPSDSSSIIQPTVVSPGGKVSIDSDTQLGLTGTYMLTDNWGLEILAASPFTHTVSFDGDLKGLGSLATAKHLPPTISAQYFFNASGRLSPYVGLGVNYTLMLETRATTNGRAVLDSVGTNGDHSIEADDSVDFSVQAGFDYSLNEKIIFNAAIRYIAIDTTIEVANILEVDLDIDPWVYMIALGYKF